MSLAGTINKLTQKKDFGDAFIEAMDMSIRANDVKRASKPNIKPSKASCLREMYYILRSTTPDKVGSTDPNGYLMGQEGSAMHEVIQKILSKAKAQGIEVMDPAEAVTKAQQAGINTIVRESPFSSQYEVNAYNEDYDVSFMFDGVVRFQGKKCILEIKNEDHFKFLKRSRAEEAHEAQATFYSICLGIDYVLFLYVNRNYKIRKAYLLEITEDMKATQIARIKVAKYCANKKMVPGKEENKNCKWCNYKKTCKQDGDQSHIDKIKPEELV